MAAKSANTRTRIVEAALSAFNERGVEYVGLRELAAHLDIHVGNITYYFPTKDDLVTHLASELNALNAQAIGESGGDSIGGFLEMLRAIFRNQVRYRCLMVSIVHIMERNRTLSDRHKRTQRERNEMLARRLRALEEAGDLRASDETERAALAEAIGVIARFWISEAAISFRRLSPERQLEHYVTLVARILRPYATERGGEALAGYL